MIFDDASSSELEDHFKVHRKDNDEPLSDCVRRALDNYFTQIDGHDINNLYQMVIDEVERPLFESILSYTGGNQTRAATLLGISRSTLRKKMSFYGID
ncbi:MAG: DNA-binding transcriptional regulator Fis [bacterium]